MSSAPNDDWEQNDEFIRSAVQSLVASKKTVGIDEVVAEVKDIIVDSYDNTSLFLYKKKWCERISLLLEEAKVDIVC